MSDGVKWVLIDSCGATATLAVGQSDAVLATEELPGRGFSAEWPAALRRLLAAAGWNVGELQVVGVVHGPGSFTGVRVGLAAAKGLCEATGAGLIALSRLEVLAAQGEAGALAVFDAGRDEFYVRDGEVEVLYTCEEMVAAAQERAVVTTDVRVVDVLGQHAGVVMVELIATSALPLMLTRWEQSALDDVGVVDANYVRGERDIYARKPVVSSASE